MRLKTDYLHAITIMSERLFIVLDNSNDSMLIDCIIAVQTYHKHGSITVFNAKT